MIKGLTNFFVKLVKKYLPDAYTFAIIIVICIFLVGIAFCGQSFTDMVSYWGEGFWSMATFTFQMIMVMFTGYALASAPVIKKVLLKFAKIPKTNMQAVVLLYTTTFALCYFNWGLGLIGGAILAKEIARVRKGMHFPLLVAVAYGANNTLLGLSSAVPLMIATPGHAMEAQMGIFTLRETLFSSWNIILTVASFAICIFLYAKMAPKKGDPSIIEADITLFDEAPMLTEKPRAEMNINERLDTSKILAYLLVFIGLAFIVLTIMNSGANMDITSVIILFYVLGLLAYGNPKAYGLAVKDAMESCAGIACQFPIYASIMGMMKATGITSIMAGWFINISNENTFVALSFLSAGLINFLIPGGGSQWLVQGPIMIEAALNVGNVDLAKVAMACGWGDVWTNLCQPFWAIPVLAVAKMDLREIMGYCVVVMLGMGVVLTGLFLII